MLSRNLGKKITQGACFIHLILLPVCSGRLFVALFFHSGLKPDNIAAAAGLRWVIRWYFQIHAVLKPLELNLVLCKWQDGNIYSFGFPLSAVLPDVPISSWYCDSRSCMHYRLLTVCFYSSLVASSRRQTPACVGQEDLGWRQCRNRSRCMFAALLGWRNACALLLPSCEAPPFLGTREDFGVLFLETKPPN